MRARGIRISSVLALYIGFGQPLVLGGGFGNPDVFSPLFLAFSVSVGALGLFSLISPAWWITWQLKRQDRFLAWWRKLPSRAESPPQGLAEALQELEWSRVEMDELRTSRSVLILVTAVGIAGFVGGSALLASGVIVRAVAPGLLPLIQILFLAAGILGLGVGVLLARRWLALPQGLESGMRELEGRLAWTRQQFWTRF